MVKKIFEFFFFFIFKKHFKFYFKIEYPNILKPLEPTIEILEKTECILECIIVGNPSPSISWFKNKAMLSENDNIIFESNQADGLYRCLIKSSELTDGGTYMIKAKNAVGEVLSTTQLSIVTAPKITRNIGISGANTGVLKNMTSENNFTLIEKSPLKLDCQIQATPKAIVTWFKNSSEIKQDERIKFENKQNDYSIAFKTVSIDDSGEYEVKAENNSGVVTSKIQVSVCSLPVIIQKLTDAETVLGKDDKHEFICLFRGKPKPELIWFFNDKPLPNLPFYSAFDDETMSEDKIETYKATLRIDKIDFEVAGQYKCCIKNCAGEAQSSGNLVVLKTPVIIERLPEKLEVLEGKEIKLKCILDADCTPTPTVSWFKGQTALVASKKIQISKPVIDKEANTITYTISVFESSSTDCGTYTVKISNKALTVESSCLVEIIAPPKIIKDMKKSIECNEGDSVSLEVHATGKPAPAFKWYHVDSVTSNEIEVLEKPDTIVISSNENKVFTLEFKIISKMDCGTYILRLANDAGKIESVTNIIINGMCYQNFFFFFFLVFNKFKHCQQSQFR